MEVDFLLLADGAQVAGDKLYVLGGGWTVVWSKEFPVTHKGAVSIGMLVGWEETNRRHAIEVVLLSEDGQQVGKSLITGEFEVGRPPGMIQGIEQRFMLVGNVDLGLDKPGRYELVVRVNGGDMKRTAFSAVEIPTGVAA